jgi:hypothetical protein
MQTASLLSPKFQNSPQPQTNASHEKRQRAALLSEDQYLNASLALMAGLKSRMALGTQDTHAFENRANAVQ